MQGSCYTACRVWQAVAFIGVPAQCEVSGCLGVGWPWYKLFGNNSLMMAIIWNWNTRIWGSKRLKIIINKHF